MNTLAERLVHTRQLRQMTQAELARACHVAQSTIANYESGLRKSPRNILKLATVLKVNVLWLAEGSGPMESGMPQTRLTVADGQPATALISHWPFRNISPAAYWALPDTDRDLMERTMESLMASLSARQPSSKQ